MFVKFICEFKSDGGISAAAARFYQLIIFRCFHVFIGLFFLHFFSPFIALKQEKEKYVSISIF